MVSGAGMGEWRLARVRWTDIGEPLPLVVVPLGSTEQHGPHLPAGTDTTIAGALADGLARQRGDLLVAPALPYGASGEHAGFPATMSLGTAAFELAVVELVRSMDLTARGVILVNGHGGNARPLADATRLLVGEGRRVLAWSPRGSDAGDLHAGRMETSLMLHLAPDLVAPGLAVAGPTPPLRDLIRRGVRPLSPSGVLGDPAGATAAEGAAVLRGFVAELAAAVDAWDEAGHRG
jgi:mycofactocin precursor peptide peptidase